MRTLNLGILAHVDAGKTTLTERLLHAAGVVDEVGSVDHGSAHTDSLALERRRGITIKSAVASFVVDDVVVNLIDTPGHSDFIAEVERVLHVLDGVVLVISAVEGVQPQTRVLQRTLQRLGIPTIFFVNKIDRVGAQYDQLLEGISDRLTPAIVPMGTVHGLGARGASFVAHAADDTGFHAGMLDVLAAQDDDLLSAYVDDEASLSTQRLRHELARQVGQARAHPVFFGSALAGVGIDALTAGLTQLLPAVRRDGHGPASGSVFKVDRGPSGEKISYVSLTSGTVRVRDQLPHGRGRSDKVTAIKVFDRGRVEPRRQATAGEIAQVWGLSGARIDDTVGESTSASQRHFAPPTLETVVSPAHARDKAALHAALTQLTEQDPLINVRQDDVRQEMTVWLYGEVQKEVIAATLSEEFGLDVQFRETTTVCLETPAGSGADVEFIAKEPNPFLATVGLRVDPAPTGAGVRFQLEVELGSMPSAFFHAVEEAVYATLEQGIHGWQVVDCTVTMTHSGYWARQSSAHGTFDASMSSTAGDFRHLTPLVLSQALRRAGATVMEPMHRFDLEFPADALPTVLPVLSRVQAVPHSTVTQGSRCAVHGVIPAAQVHSLQQRLPGATRGEGVLECVFDRHQPVRGAVPVRRRIDRNPFNRKEYLLAVAGRRD